MLKRFKMQNKKEERLKLPIISESETYHLHIGIFSSTLYFSISYRTLYGYFYYKIM